MTKLWGATQNVYKLLNQGALKFLLLTSYLSMYGQDILYGISKGNFEIPH